MEKKKQNKFIKYFIIVGIVVIVTLLLWFVFKGNKEEKWVQSDNKVSKGDVTYEVGDYYDYDETNHGKITGLTDVKWKILGVNEDGNLLIVSASNVDEVSLGSDEDIEISKKDYIEGNQKLDEISSKYAKGENAISGRSITADDVNMITNIDQDYLKSLEKTFTYYWTNEENPVSKDNSTGEIYVTKLAHNGSYLWFDINTNEWKLSEKSGTETEEEPTEIITLYNSHIAYNFSIFDEEKNDYVDIMEKDTKEYNMLFLDDKGNKSVYWTSTKFISATQSYSAYGYNVVKGSDLNYNYLV